MLERTKVAKEILSEILSNRQVWDADDIMNKISEGYPQIFNLSEEYEHWELLSWQNNVSAFHDAINKVVKSFRLKITQKRNDAQLLLGLDIDTEYIQHYYYVEREDGAKYVPVEEITEDELIAIYENGKAKEIGQRKWNLEHAMLFELRFGKKIQDAIKSRKRNNTADKK